MADMARHSHEDSDEDIPLPVHTENGKAVELTDEEHELDQNATAKSAYYDYSSEKSTSQAEAKMFYHRHRMESSQGDKDSYSPITRSNTFSAFEPASSLSRSGSTASTKKGSRKTKDRSATINTDNRIQAADSLLGDIPEHTDTVERSNGDAEDQNLDINDIPIPVHLASIIPELRTICTNIKNALTTRRKYIELSLQTWADNPKNKAGWEINPPPPVPVWDEEKHRPDLSNSAASLGSQGRRKAGQDIGEDFHPSDILPVPDKVEGTAFELNNESVFQVLQDTAGKESTKPIFAVPTLRDYYVDLGKLTDWSADGPSKTFAYKQLEILEGKFNVYAMENAYQETADAKLVPHRDFYNVRKVDTHVHHSSCMNQKHLLRYIKSKMKKSPHEKVMYRDGQHMTLEEVFRSIDLNSYDLSIDTLDMHVSFRLLRSWSRPN